MNAQILLVACLILVVHAEYNCSNNGVYSAVSNKCYYIFDVPQTFNFAQRICNDFGSLLVCIHNAFEETLVFGLTREKLRSNADYWIGLSDSKEENSWVWPDGSTASYVYWAEGFPMDLPNFQCVAGLSSSGRWYNTLCDENMFPFVCESAPSAHPSPSAATVPPTTPLLTVSPTTLVKDGWTYYPATDSWYKGILNETADWQSYEGLCVAEGGHMVSIHSTEEARFVQDLEWWVSPYIAMLFIGLRADDTPPYAFTIFTDGTPVDYNNWMGYPYEQQPNYCVVLFPMQAWESVHCSDRGDTVGTVCKKPNK